MILLPRHLAEAIEWVLRPKKDAAPDLSRLTSEQLQLLPLQVAQAFMDLSVAALQQPARRGKPDAPAAPKPREVWTDPRGKQRARQARERVNALTASHQRLLGWYIQTGNARQHGFKR